VNIVPEETFESFMRRYGRADRVYPVIEVGDSIEAWPSVVVRFGDKSAVIQFCGIGPDSAGDGEHLSIDIHAFVAERWARAGVFGMEEGKRYHAFNDTTPGTSHGWPAVRGVSVLIGKQTTRDSCA
jgi:hypothetical protein